MNQIFFIIFFTSPGQTSTLVNDRISPYSSVLHGAVLRSYISVSYTEEYGDIRRKNGRLRTLYR
jgi:hypothetical protein